MKVTWEDGKVRITWRNREVENPIARFFIIVVAIIAAPFIVIGGVLGAVLAIVLLIALSPIWIPGHFLLRACGRRGFCTNEGRLEITLSAEAFRKA